MDLETAPGRMGDSPELARDLRGLKVVALVATVVWTLLVALSHFWIDYQDHAQTLNLAANAARANFDKDQAFRLWATRHGGVYVPPDARTPPNPYLAHIPDRDVVTTKGKKLTLMNPAYMLRQTMEEYGELYGVKGRITSLKPLNPNNAPDDWERAALLAFEKGTKEVSEVTEIDGKPYFRLIKPMVTKAGCLKCHAHQGYKVGDIRGGVGVAVPMTPFLEAEVQNSHAHSLVYGAIWVLGLVGIGGTARWRRNEALRRHGILATLHRHLRDQRLTAEIAQLAFEPLSLDDMLSRTLDKVLANEELGLLSMGCVFLIDDASGDLVMRAEKGFGASLRAACARMTPGTCLCGKAAATGEAIFTSHVGDDHETRYDDMPPHGHYCVPIKARDEVLGVLNVYVEEGHQPSGDEERFLGIVTDTLANVIGRRQAEEKLHASVSELTRINVELERFATVAAHDLQEPVRNVLSYVQRLERSLGERLADDDAEYFSFVLDGATRIRMLVSDLQAYTQVATHGSPYRPVEIAGVLEVVLSSLRDSIAETACFIDIGDMPEVPADEAQLTMLFQHLIGNAIKFRKENDPPRITIHAERQGGDWLFSVTDNGIGIDPAYAHRIFEVFRRLHTSSTYPGTGIGLALCKQIVERHGGRIWVESEPDGGSRFLFTLPSSPRNIPQEQPG